MLDSWEFSTSDGASAGDIAMATSVIQQTEFALDYTQFSFPRLPFDLYDGSRTSYPPDSLPCEKGWQVLQQIYSGAISTQPLIDCVDRGLAGSAFSVIFAGIGSSVSATHLSASGGISGATTDPAQPRFLYRFGVLLAANAEAHLAVPELPQAPADEINAIAGS